MKHYLPMNVELAARQRVQYILDHFKSFYVSFSGGKDSGILLHIAIEESEKKGRLPVEVLIVDLECQYEYTIDFIRRMIDSGKIKVFWVCLPLNLRNSVSQFQPHWRCWDPDKQQHWIRELPKEKGVISDINHFPFYFIGMEFEEFVCQFAQWYQQSKASPIAVLIGLRSDESLHRYRTIKNRYKKTFNQLRWTTEIAREVYLAYPIYDWRVEDIWIANGRFGWDYNRLYDVMQMAGVPLSQQRICQPFGDDQRKGLWLYQIIEPHTWQKLVERVEGCHFGARYSKDQGHLLGYYRFELPEGYTYKRYAKWLLETMPPNLATHYRTRIYQFLKWWQKNGKSKGVYRVCDYADPKLEAQKKVPSWRRICRVLIKNDFWCRGLSFGQNKSIEKACREQYSQFLK